jgi:hypothetical protein
MKTTLKLAAALVAAAGFAVTASAQDASVPAALKGKLIEYKDGKIQDATIAADKDYYVLYHSASW